MRKQKGFSLIELLIVVAIILIIAAIAIPNLLRSKMAANESSAVGSTRTLATSEITYNNSYQVYATLAQLGTGGTGACGTASSATACLIDSSLANAIDTTHKKSGYIFSATPVAGTDFAAEGHPDTVGTDGARSFCTTPEAVVRQDPSGVANTTSAACILLKAI